MLVSPRCGRLVLRRTLRWRWPGMGILVVLAASPAATTLIVGFVYGANGADPLVLTAGAAFLLAVGLRPAIRAGDRHRSAHERAGATIAWAGEACCQSPRNPQRPRTSRILP